MTEPEPERIYIASKTKHGPLWKRLRADGWPIISTWIDEHEQGATSDWADLWRRCIDEVKTATALIMYVEDGEHHKGSMVEVGVALACGVPVYWVGPEVGTVRRAPGVTTCETIWSAFGGIIGARKLEDVSAYLQGMRS